MEQPSRLFVTGMFRSGTTLVARMLAAHPAIAFANDPYAPLFKEVRNAVAQRQSDIAFDRDAPLDDYYFDPAKIALLDADRTVDLASLPAPDDLGPLRARLARQCAVYSPRVTPLLDRFAGATFAELFASAYDIVAAAYGDGTEQAAGIKEVWAGEFVWPLLAAFPDACAIVVVRDPRAVVASKNVRADKYPWLFLARQWRKLSALAWLAAHDPALAGRVHLVRYEDLITAPDATARNMCAAAGIDYHAGLADPSTYRDGAGEPWSQNSSHFADVRAFNTGSIERWRDVLHGDEVAFVEAVCWPEMLLHGYTPRQFNPLAPADGPFVAPPVVPCSDLAKWIRKYASEDAAVARDEMTRERLRTEILTGRTPPLNGEYRADLLDARLHQPLKDAIEHGLH